MKRGLWLLGLIVLVAASSHADVVPIADVKTIYPNGDGVSNGKQVTVSGVVTVRSDIFSKTDLDVYIQDATAGINVTKKNAGFFKLRLGDSIVVTGTVDQGGAPPSKGTTKIFVADLKDISIVGRGTVPEPAILDAARLNRDGQPPLELYEGRLVRVEHVTMNPLDWPPAGIDKLITCEDPTGSLKLRIDRDTDIGGTQPPRQPFIAIGVVVQDDQTAPTLSNYVVWPGAKQSDFLAMGNGSGVARLDPVVVDNSVGSFDLAVTLTGNGTDTITAFSVDLPVSDGWGWPSPGVELAGPGLTGATYEIGSAGVTVSGASILDDRATYGTVTLKRISPPATLVSSSVVVKTSVDGTSLVDIAVQPSLRSVRPKPLVVINEVYPNDGAAAKSDAFIELHNRGASTAYLQDFVLCESRPVPYCDVEVRCTFTSADTIPAGGYFVVAEASLGLAQRFGVQPNRQAAINLLGKVTGDGGICDGEETYEAISLWRDGSLSDLVDYVEYRNAIGCSTDMCGDFGAAGDALPCIPPVGYAITSREWSACCPYEALSAAPTPGAENRQVYLNPTILKVSSYSQNIVEVFFSEPIDPRTIAEKSNFRLNGEEAIAVYASLSGDKALFLFEDSPLGSSAALELTGLASWADMAMRDTVYSLTVTLNPCTKVCDIQAFDTNGYSPLNGKSVTMFGFITVPPGVFQPQYQSIYVQGLDGCGTNVFSYSVSSPRPRLGDFVSVSGEVTEYISSKAGSTTEISMSSQNNLTIYSRGYPEPEALVLSTGNVSREQYEGRLVQAEGAVVTASDFSFYIDDGSGGIQVYQNYLPIDFTRFHQGMDVRVKGVILQYDYTLPFLEGYELVPRYDSDIEIVTDAFPGKASLDVEARVFCPSCGEESFPIKFGAPPQSLVTLRLFDSAGRLVSTLYSGLSLGEREIAWSGRDADGKPLPAGLYVCHVEAVEAVSSAESRASAPIVIGTHLK
ncbi:MAG: FlgD immunoglobulin-like domain containing protein [Candidatus Eisenbacteria bacterium]